MVEERALSIAGQVELLKQRGLTVDDEDMAAEVLSIIGFYRLGFYLFPFEEAYPDLCRRNHVFTPGANFADAVKLYYFDLELRMLLLKYISGIEIKFRAVLAFEGSYMYRHDPQWFVNRSYVSSGFIKDFDKVVYNKKFRNNPTIRLHHRFNRDDAYAPAWKTIELMTFGENVKLYNSLLDGELKRKIAAKFGVRYVEVFENYIEQMRILRNVCAHGSVMFEYRPCIRIKKGPAALSNQAEYMNLYGCIKVVAFLVSQISDERRREFDRDLERVVGMVADSPRISRILIHRSGFPARIIR